MNFFIRTLALLVFLLLPALAEARTFNFKAESFGAYFRGTGALSHVGTDQFDKSSGVGTGFDKKAKYNLSGEVGFIAMSTSRFNLRLGLELLTTDSLIGTTGSNSSGAELFDLDSRILALNPVATIEYFIRPTNNSRWLGYVGLGYADVTLKNKYSFTTAGQTAFSQGAAMTETSNAKVMSITTGMGYEILFVDSVTAMFDLGYRYMPVNKLTYSKSGTGIDGTDYGKGDKVLNYDGSPRTFDLSGFYVGASFRFYINFR